jgi:hypothetical protein
VSGFDRKNEIDIKERHSDDMAPVIVVMFQSNVGLLSED